jgi:hypothetical protein
MSINDALRKASEYSQDLVEISPNAKPPVCKIMDYGRYKYEITKKYQEARKKQKASQIKEIKGDTAFLLKWNKAFYTKLKLKDFAVTKDDFNFRPFSASLMALVGYGQWNLYMTYNLTDIFNEGSALSMRGVNAGILLSF